MDDIERLNPNDFICLIRVNGKEYSVYADEEDEELINIYLRTSLGNNQYVLTDISDEDMGPVIEEFNKIMAVLDESDELDIDEEEKI